MFHIFSPQNKTADPQVRFQTVSTSGFVHYLAKVLRCLFACYQKISKRKGEKKGRYKRLFACLTRCCCCCCWSGPPQVELIEYCLRCSDVRCWWNVFWSVDREANLTGWSSRQTYAKLWVTDTLKGNQSGLDDAPAMLIRFSSNTLRSAISPSCGDNMNYIHTAVGTRSAICSLTVQVAHTVASGGTGTCMVRKSWRSRD